MQQHPESIKLACLVTDELKTISAYGATPERLAKCTEIKKLAGIKVDDSKLGVEPRDAAREKQDGIAALAHLNSSIDAQTGSVWFKGKEIEAALMKQVQRILFRMTCGEAAPLRRH